MTDAIDAVTFYWRPGCGFCARLDRALTGAGVPLDRRDIWQDPGAAETVRSLARGHETVPTVVVGERALVNPTPDEVMGVLTEAAPDLVPDDWTPPQPGRAGRAMRRLLGGGEPPTPTIR